MIYLVSLFSVAHVIFYLMLTIKWSRIKPSGSGRTVNISVVIPVRNEAHNILNLLNDLARQGISTSKFEVIVVDDFSSDRTFQVLQEFAKETTLDLTLGTLSNKQEKGKKHALTRAIELAKYEVILTTDADCRVNAQWVQTFAKAFSPKTNIVAGPVTLQGKGLFASLQKVEFAGLVGFGAATLASNNPSMCSGANLAFRSQAFFTVGGYKSNIHIPTGDDEFLLYDVLKKFPGSGHFLKEENAIVHTSAHQSFNSFLNQRARWIGKWKHNKNRTLRMLAILFFLDYAILIGTIIIVSIGRDLFPLSLGLGLLLIRFTSELIFLKPTCSFLKVRHMAGINTLLQLFYPLHVFFMGLLSIFDQYTWKGRRY